MILGPSHGELDSFEVQPNGDVMVWVSDEENYAHRVLVTYKQLAGLYEAANQAAIAQAVSAYALS